MLGHCAAGTAYIPALADFVPMVKGTSSMALAGRHLVKAATGEDVTEEEMGGSDVHTKVSGVADLEVARDEECLAMVRSTCRSSRATTRRAAPVADVTIPSIAVAKRCTTSCRPHHDGRTTCGRSSTPLSTTASFFEMKPQWARNIITGLAHVGGRRSAIVANQPMVLGGALDVNAADKAARFVWLCDAFGIPLVFLHDVPGFIVGTAVEKQGIIRHGAKMLFAVSEATVPKVSIVLRKSYGAGYFVMNGTRVRGRLPRRLADRRDRRDGTGRHGQHHDATATRASSRRERSAMQARIAWPRSSARTSTRTSRPGTRRSTT